MEAGSRTELPATAYQLAEQYHIGQPLAFHNMHPRWIRFYRTITNMLLGVVICVVLFVLALVALFLYQVIKGQVPDVQMRLLLGLPGILVGLLGCIGCMIIRGMIVRRIPVSLLMGTEGLLEIRPKEVDVIHWDEVRGMLQELRLGRRKSYQLDRINREPLRFGEVFEDMEDLINVVRQQIQRGSP